MNLLIGPNHPFTLRALLLAGGTIFLIAAGTSFVYAGRSRAQSVDPPTDISSPLSRLATLKSNGHLEELVRTLCQRAKIARRKLSLLRLGDPLDKVRCSTVQTA